MAKILFVVNNPAFFLSHRLPIALAAREQGYEVEVATMDGPTVAKITALGFTHHKIPMSRSGTNPFQELKTIYFLYKLFQRVQPDLVHLVTIKPVLYGGIAARLARVGAVVYAISGLGFVFTGDRKGLIKTVAMQLYKRALGHNNSRVIVQNRDDQQVLVNLGAALPEQVVLIRGAGVDTEEFAARAEPTEPIVITMAARLLKDKGVMEYVAAAQLAREDGYVWQLAGSIDRLNPASLTEVEFEAIAQQVQALGERNDIAYLYQQSHIVVLPSYREGIPKSLLEAASCARAIVTTDVPGCREAIVDGVSGILVPVKSAEAIYAAVKRMASDRELRLSMGMAGRELALREFAMPIIVNKHLDIYKKLLPS